MARAVVSLCDKTGKMVRPWAEAGYDCVCYDLQHEMRNDKQVRVGKGIITYRWANVRSLTLADIGEPSIVFAFPPCTDLASSGARDWQKKGLRGLIDALELVEACRQLCENSKAKWALENPVGWLSSRWREPDYMFDPCDYGDPYTKKTCLWTGGGFIMPLLEAVDPTEGSKIISLSPSVERQNERSATPEGFARAVFKANQAVM